MKQPRSDLKKLQRIWYRKLKSEGFTDIEDTETGFLKDWHGYLFQRDFNATEYNATVQYFDLAKDFFNEHGFKDEFEKEIWRLHTEGSSIREISAWSGAYISRFPLFVTTSLYIKRGRISKFKVHELIGRLRHKMKYDD